MDYETWSGMDPAERDEYIRRGREEWADHLKAHMPEKMVDRAESAAVWKGLGLYVLGMKSLGHRCGYVALPATHPLYRVKYYSPDMPAELLDVHGGITFSTLIDGWWVLGWDAAHYDDAPDPELLEDASAETRRILLQGADGHVWTAGEAFDETVRFAEQLWSYGVHNGWSE